MTAELGTILGLSIPVILSVAGVAWRMGRVKGQLPGVEQSPERLHVDVDRLRNDMNCLQDDIDSVWEDVKAALCACRRRWGRAVIF